jgi:diguanylate cyclase (GGDEF)-like protein
MPLSLPTAIDAGDIPPRFRRFSRWVLRTGVIRVTLLLTLLGSLVSWGLTWLIVRMVLGHADMGSAFWISLIVPLPLSLVIGGACCYLVASLEQAWGTVNEMAMQDALTGLSNRRRFVPAARRELDLALRHRQNLAIVLLDVDHFKAINDAFGHQHGDTVLVEVARRCQRALRTTDLLARWGGEEFIMLLPNTPPPQARQLADRVREAIVCAPHIRIDGADVLVTASLGAAGITQGQILSLDELITRADKALYQAKSAGRNQVAMSDAYPAPAAANMLASS